MKSRTLVSILILGLAVLIIAGSCSTRKITYNSKEFEIYGTWVNTGYNNTDRWSKIVFYPDGIDHCYMEDNSTVVSVEEEFIITNKWIDSKGNTFYTMRFSLETTPIWAFCLLKISNAGKTLEYDVSLDDYPKEIDPQKSGVYSIYYRQ